MPSNKIRTQEQLNDELNNAFLWRQQELSELKSLIRGTQSKIEKDCLLRSGIAVLYAHWEGFVKEAGTIYLSFVSMRRLRYEELAPNFIAFAVKAKLNQVTQTNKSEIHNEVVRFLLNDLSDRSHIPYSDKVINTKGNLRSHVFRDIIHLLGLEYLPIYELREKLIDIRLVDNRNEVAHGRYLNVEEKDFFEILEKILELMRIYRNQILYAAEGGLYKRQTDVHNLIQD